MHSIAHYLGLTNGSGYWYLWWSGFFANILIFTGVFTYLHKSNCHVNGCLRVWRVHDVVGTPYRACRKHHPVVSSSEPITPELLEAAHRKAARAGIAAHRHQEDEPVPPRGR
jgi:hypothetical protein